MPGWKRSSPPPPSLRPPAVNSRHRLQTRAVLRSSFRSSPNPPVKCPSPSGPGNSPQTDTAAQVSSGTRPKIARDASRLLPLRYTSLFADQRARAKKLCKSAPSFNRDPEEAAAGSPGPDAKSWPAASGGERVGKGLNCGTRALRRAPRRRLLITCHKRNTSSGSSLLWVAVKGAADKAANLAG